MTSRKENLWRLGCLLALAGAICVLSSLLNKAYGQDMPPRALVEIAERGDNVEYVPGIYEQTGLEPPASDADRWFLTVISSKNCPFCVRLLHDLRTSQYLTPYVNVNDPKKSWAHFCHFYIEDETQAWRWEHIDLAGYPTILVQPPRNGDYGPPSTVVLQLTGYDGDAKKLAAQMRASITAYIAKLNRPNAADQRWGPFRPRPQPTPQPSPGPDNVVQPTIPPPFVVPSDPNVLPTADEPPPIPSVEPTPAEPIEEPADEQSVLVTDDVMLMLVKQVLDGGSSDLLSNVLLVALLLMAYRSRAGSIKKVVDTVIAARAEISRVNDQK